MDVEVVFDLLMEAGVSVWLDADGKLRIDKAAPEEIKQLVREHKQAIIDVKKAITLMNDRGIRIIRLPLGHHALAYRPGTDLDEIRWAMKVLRMDSMPLVINDQGLRWVSYEEWQRRQPLWTKEDREKFLREREAEEQEKLNRRRRTA